MPRSLFLLTRPSRGATIPRSPGTSCPGTFLLTRPSRGATHQANPLPIKALISTHTPLAGRDKTGLVLVPGEPDFYSHAPRGARRTVTGTGNGLSPFLLTRPSRGATGCRFRIHTGRRFLLTRPSRGATSASGSPSLTGRISTHTPLAGRDTAPAHRSAGPPRFLLTRPSRGATLQAADQMID